MKFPYVKLAYGADGTFTLLSTSNPLPVNITNATVADDAAFTPATTSVVMAGFEYDDTTPDSVDEGDGGAGRMSANRCQYVNIRDNAGNERGLNIDANGALASVVTNAGTFAVQVDGDALTALQLIDNVVSVVDGAAGSTPTGIAGLAVRDDALSTLTPIEGDFVPLRTDANGALWTIPSVAYGAGTTSATTQRVSIATDDSIVTLLTSIGTSTAMLDDAVYADDADWVDGTSKHLLVGGIYQSSPHSITDGDVGPLSVTANGYLIVSVNGTVTVGSHAVTNAGTFAVQESGGALTALQIIDDWDESDRAKVNLIVGQAGIAAGAGAVGATVPRVTLASDDPGVALLTTIDADTSTLAGAVSGTEMQVDIVSGTVDLGATDNAVLDSIDTAVNRRASSHYRNIDANAEAEIKGSAGTLHWLHVINLTAAVAYLHLYDATAANVNPGTTTPNYTFAIPTAGSTNGAGFTVPLGTHGTAFANGITLVCTTTLDGSAGDPGTNGVIVNAGYA